MGNKPDRSFDDSLVVDEHSNNDGDQNNASASNSGQLDDSFRNLFDNISTPKQSQGSQDDCSSAIQNVALADNLLTNYPSCSTHPVIEINSGSECEEIDSEIEILEETGSIKGPNDLTYYKVFDKCIKNVDFNKPDLFFFRLAQKDRNFETSRELSDVSWEECSEAYVKWSTEPWKWCVYSCSNEKENGTCACKVCKFWSQVNAIRQKYCHEDLCRLSDDNCQSEGGSNQRTDDSLISSDDQVGQIEENHEIDENEEWQFFDDGGPRIRYVCRKETIVNRPHATKYKPQKFKIILSALPKSMKKNLKRRRTAVRLVKKHLFGSHGKPYIEPAIESLVVPDLADFSHVEDEAAVPSPVTTTATCSEAKLSTLRKIPIYKGIVAKRNKKRCGTCFGCLAENCGQCVYCLDMKGFGGPGLMKSACIHRRCECIWGQKRLRKVRSRPEHAELQIN